MTHVGTQWMLTLVADYYPVVRTAIHTFSVPATKTRVRFTRDNHKITKHSVFSAAGMGAPPDEVCFFFFFLN